MRQHSDNAHILARDTNEPNYIRTIDWERHGIYAGRSENPRRKVQSTRVIKRNGQSAFLSDVRKRGREFQGDTAAPKAKGHGNVEK